MINFKAKINSKCTEDECPCAFTFEIKEKLQSFNDVVNVFSSRGFTVKEFVDDHLCILSRDNEGFNEAVKIKDKRIQIQAMKETILDLCDDLEAHCSAIKD